MIIVKANKSNCKDIMYIINQAKEYLKSQNVDQWQNGYPNFEVINEDIESKRGFVVIDNGEIIGYFAMSYSDEEVYNQIYDGKWSNNEEYALIHRFCIKNEFKGNGIGSSIISYVQKQALDNNVRQIRIDTHELNKSMLRLFEKNKFKYVGKVCFRDNEERVAYELIF